MAIPNMGPMRGISAFAIALACLTADIWRAVHSQRWFHRLSTCFILPIHRERLLQIADRCPVHRTLHSEMRVNTELVDT